LEVGNLFVVTTKLILSLRELPDSATISSGLRLALEEPSHMKILLEIRQPSRDLILMAFLAIPPNYTTSGLAGWTPSVGAFE
jgi:hypothetical protein